jgi:hypothetical protein
MSVEVLERLNEAIDAVADVDVDTLTDSQLDEFVIALQRARHRLVGATTGALARWDGVGVWLSDGSRSAATRLARDAATSTSTAHVELRRARNMREMSATAAALTEGRLSPDHVDLLGRADQPHRHDLFTRDEQVLVDQCAELRYSQAVRAVDYWIQRADAECDEGSAPDPSPASRLHASTTLDGTVRLDGSLDRIDGAIVTGELSRLERGQYLADQAVGITRTHSQRLAAAVVEMATRSASAPADARRPKPLFTVLLGDDSFARLCELANGSVISPEVLVPHLGVGELETLLFDGPFTVIAASTARSFTGRLRRAIEVRDRHCQHPSGCDVPAVDCDVDHIVPAGQGGVTSQFNGKLECWPHNRDACKHDHGATPAPERPVTVLDEIRARLRWRYHHDDGGDPDPVDTPAA